MSAEKSPTSNKSTSTSSMTSVRKLRCLQPFTRLVNGGMERFFGRSVTKFHSLLPFYHQHYFDCLVFLCYGGMCVAKRPALGENSTWIAFIRGQIMKQESIIESPISVAEMKRALAL